MTMPVKRYLLRSWIVFVTLLATLGADANNLDPDAPPRIRDFAFLIGSFTCSDTFIQLDGTTESQPSSWKGEWILGGHGIQDHYSSPRFNATNVRTFDQDKGQWKVAYFREPGGVFGLWASKSVSSNMIVLEREFQWNGAAAVSRLTFSLQSADEFQWRSEYLSGGQQHVDWKSHCLRER